MGIQWVNGKVTELNPQPRVLAVILGDNGTTYRLKDNGFAPEDRGHAVRVGDRVRFEDRQGYVMDLRHI